MHLAALGVQNEEESGDADSEGSNDANELEEVADLPHNAINNNLDDQILVAGDEAEGIDSNNDISDPVTDEGSDIGEPVHLQFEEVGVDNENEMQFEKKMMIRRRFI